MYHNFYFLVSPILFYRNVLLPNYSSLLTVPLIHFVVKTLCLFMVVEVLSI